MKGSSSFSVSSLPEIKNNKSPKTKTRSLLKIKKSLLNFSRYGYSLFAILIFLFGVYFGAKYSIGTNLPENYVSKPNPSAARISIPSSVPEDWVSTHNFRVD
jgi:hypothetical protein